MKMLLVVVVLAVGCSAGRGSLMDAGGVGGGGAKDAGDAVVDLAVGGGAMIDASSADLRGGAVDLGEARDAGPVGNVPCKTAGDCRLYSSSCGGCHCIPLGKNDPDPVCSGGMVSCFLDPCL